jgi:hypothetical protein
VSADQVANRGQETRRVLVLVLVLVAVVVVPMMMIRRVRTALRPGSLGVAILLVRVVVVPP